MPETWALDERYEALDRDTGGVPPWAIWLLLGAATVLLSFSKAQGFLYGEDTVLYFNAVNGLEHPPLLQVYNRYVSVGPGLVAAAAAWAPLWLQPLLYAAVALGCGVLTGDAVFRLLRLFHDTVPAMTGALTTLLLLHAYCPPLFLSLAYVIWSLLAYGAARLARWLADGARPSAAVLGLLALTAISNPVSLAWAPLLAHIALRARGRDRLVALGLLAVIVAYLAGTLIVLPRQLVGASDFAAALRKLVGGDLSHVDREVLTHAVALAGAVGVAVLGVRVARTVGETSRPALVALHLGVFGVVGSLVYFASDRFTVYGTFSERYLVPITFGLYLAAWALARGRLNARRATAIAGAAAAALFLVYVGTGHVGGFLQEAVARERFALQLHAFRADCAVSSATSAPGRSDRWPLTLGCKRWATPPLAAMGGFYSPDGSGQLVFVAQASLDRPGVYVGPAPFSRGR